MQNDFIFAGTLLENIDFYRNIEEKQLIQAIENAQGNFIFDLEHSISIYAVIFSKNLGAVAYSATAPYELTLLLFYLVQTDHITGNQLVGMQVHKLAIPDHLTGSCSHSL